MNTPKDTLPRKHILLVEDERLVRETIKLLLCQDGHTVVEANNGAEAFGVFTQARFDLVMVDFELPFVKGNELAARIRRLAPQQPIMMMTGYRREAGPDNPVDLVVNKPLNFARLRNAMSQMFPEKQECAAAAEQFVQSN